ncbi:hypothetical protein BDW71DRAFT_190625 [Aspergillus fruticulosus]
MPSSLCPLPFAHPQPSISSAVARMALHMTVDKPTMVESFPGCPGFWGFLGSPRIQ